VERDFEATWKCSWKRTWKRTWKRARKRTGLETADLETADLETDLARALKQAWNSSADSPIYCTGRQ
jgi:hypothetical protein